MSDWLVFCFIILIKDQKRGGDFSYSNPSFWSMTSFSVSTFRPNHPVFGKWFTVTSMKWRERLLVCSTQERKRVVVDRWKLEDHLSRTVCPMPNLVSCRSRNTHSPSCQSPLSYVFYGEITFCLTFLYFFHFGYFSIHAPTSLWHFLFRHSRRSTTSRCCDGDNASKRQKIKAHVVMVGCVNDDEYVLVVG